MDGGNYEIILYRSEEDKLYIAEVPELKGCFADGKTRAEALSNAEGVIAEWLEVAKEDGIAIPKEKAKSCYSMGEYPSSPAIREPRELSHDWLKTWSY